MELTDIKDTEVCQVVSVQVGSTGFAIVDCPGFNDTYRSSTDILQEISKVFCAQSVLSDNLKLKGILYLHGIDNSRMEGSHLEALTTLEKIVGDVAFPNVVLVTTKWENIPISTGMKRESDLREIFWKRMIEKGSSMARFDGDGPSAQGIVSQLLKKPRVSTALQHELLNENKTLLETSAGGFLALGVQARYEYLKKDLLELSKKMSEEKNGTRRIVLQYDKDRVEAEKACILSDKKKLDSRVGVETKSAVEAVKARRRSMKAKGKFETKSAVEAVKAKRGSMKATGKFETYKSSIQTFCSVLGFGMTVVVPLAGGSCVVM